MAEQIPVTSVWLTCQRPAREQRRGRYVDETARHPGKMLPDLAAHAIKAYTAPGDLVMDPMCGSGTTLVEAVRSARDGIGVDIEPKFTAIAQANLALAAAHGHTSWGQAVTGDGRNLAALLPASSHGKVSLVLTSPPYGRSTHGIVRNAPGTGVHKRHHLYGDRGAGNLAYLGWDQLLDGWRQIVAGCRQMLRPGGVFVFTCRPVRRTRDDLIDLPGELFAAAMSAGLEPVERCVAMLAAVRDGQIIHRASMFALMAVRKARADGIPVAVVAHEDVYVLRKPSKPAGSSPHSAGAADLRCQVAGAVLTGPISTTAGLAGPGCQVIELASPHTHCTIPLLTCQPLPQAGIRPPHWGRPPTPGLTAGQRHIPNTVSTSHA